MVKAAGLIYCSLFPLKQDSPVISGRALRFVKAPLPTAPHGSEPMVWVGHVGGFVVVSRAVRQVPCSPPVMVSALPVATLTTVLVSHPPATPFTKPLRPSRPGRL